jgi:hypothetical protein
VIAAVPRQPRRQPRSRMTARGGPRPAGRGHALNDGAALSAPRITRTDFRVEGRTTLGAVGVRADDQGAVTGVATWGSADDAAVR